MTLLYYFPLCFNILSSINRSSKLYTFITSKKSFIPIVTYQKFCCNITKQMQHLSTIH
ncbi:MAG: hypothetical protein JJT76_19775 [Clostridiaceae bacterium]|nr:hypothetical protein [Clostridiaceae bacterium]